MDISEFVELLTSQGVELRAEEGQVKAIGPPSVLTAAMLSQLKANKQELLEFLESRFAWRQDITPDGIVYSRPDTEPQRESLWPIVPKKNRQLHRSVEPGQCPKCGSQKQHHVPIHNGQSTRADCADCGRFIDFVRWYGQTPSEN